MADRVLGVVPIKLLKHCACTHHHGTNDSISPLPRFHGLVSDCDCPCGRRLPVAAPANESRDKPGAAGSLTLRVPPKELVKRLQRDLPGAPLSLPIESVNDGTILTGWKEYEGAVHIVRRWRERTRFRINVLLDFHDPSGISHVEVFDETEEKPSDAQPWYPNPDLRRPERSAEVVRVIEAAAAGNP